MDTLLNDLRYALRALTRSPGFAAVVVLTLALGIGVNAAMFGIVDTLFLRPPAGVREPGRVVRIYKSHRVSLLGRSFTGGLGQFPAFVDLRASGVFERTAATTTRDMSLGRGSEAVRVRVGDVSHDYFPLLGVAPAIGRFFGADEDKAGGERVAVISDAFWRSRFGRDTTVLGRRLQMGSGSFTVIGVAPAGFTGIDLAPLDLWIPISVAAGDIANGQCLTSWNCWWMEAIARLKPDDRPADAAARATAVYRRGAVPQNADDSTAQVLLGPTQAARGPVADDETKVSAWIGGVALVVLLIACANVANLLLARGVSRRRELALRAGLGAGRAGLMRLLLAESLVLAGLGGGAALILAAWGGTAARRLLIPDLPKDVPVVDLHILAFTAAAVLVAALLAGLAPAFQSSRTDVAEALKSGGRGATTRGRTRGILLAAQVALTLVLLVGAGLFVRSLRNVQALNLGFDAEKVVLATMNLSGAGFTTDNANATYLRLVDRLERLPEVERVAATTAPLGWIMATSLKAEGYDSLPRGPGGGYYQSVVTPAYFAALGTRIVHGRDFAQTDRQGSENVAIVNETMARALWPGQDGLGKCLFVGGFQRDPKTAPCSRIVGVVEDARNGQVVEDPSAHYYLAFGQQAGAGINGLYIRARGTPSGLVAAAQRAIESEGALPRASVSTLADFLAPQYRSWKLGAQAFTAFGALALLIAAMGIFAVISYSVSQRTQEIGIRMALGAETGQVARMILGQGLQAALGGIVVGGLGAFALGRAIKALLYGVTPGDPLVFVSVACVLIAVATAAAYLPARRAARVDPMVALRYE
jgi:putative ABC transport system permease protein